MQTLVSTKYQVVIPKVIRRKIGLKPGSKLNIHLSSSQIILSPTSVTENLKWPSDYIRTLPNPWESSDSKKYLEKERNSWD